MEKDDAFAIVDSLHALGARVLLHDRDAWNRNFRQSIGEFFRREYVTILAFVLPATAHWPSTCRDSGSFEARAHANGALVIEIFLPVGGTGEISCRVILP